MQLRTWDELTADQRLSQALENLTAFGPPPLPPEVDLYRRRGHHPDYVGVFAVEGPQVLGQTWVCRFPYTFDDGVGQLSGVAGVITRPDRARSGIARRILTEVHEREREAGLEHVALWTNRSWGAHRLYEKLGYQDVHHPSLAVRLLPDHPTSHRFPLRVRHATRSDIKAIEDLHGKVTRGRRGFTPRAPRYFETVVKCWPALLNSLWVATKGSEVRGWAFVDVGPRHALCSEFLAADAPAERALVEKVESLARGRFAGFYMSPASDRLPLLKARGYAALSKAWIVMMGAPLRGRSDARTLVRTFGTHRPFWVCHRSDRF